MNRNMKCWRLILALATVATLIGSSHGVLAQQNQDIVPPQQLVDGKSYSDWSAAWWQWLLAIPYGAPRPNPAGYQTGAYCQVNQSGSVWFLTGPNPNPGANLTEQCTVPAGQYILLPIINADCSTYELPAGVYSQQSNPTGPGCSTEGDCRKCASNNIDLVTAVTASIDNVAVSNLQTFRVQSPFFQFSVPDKNFFATDTPPLSGAGSGMAVSDGYWLMIKPLSSGIHTIHINGTITFPTFSFTEDVTFQITVAKPESK
ncbi:hypothetical protein FAZ95_00025 [Trinickia violacea]|uniref:Uncharacterized protein n=1 Tax=Trinickia violacea TaxID=2571746 RepID=A0A4P8ILQ7_9BURK|nr:hypothetical protein [Trinickia violacea]QCP47704.1 hypothetical protein FAZ95_00025 [Trinickia violacea]